MVLYYCSISKPVKTPMYLGPVLGKYSLDSHNFWINYNCVLQMCIWIIRESCWNAHSERAGLGWDLRHCISNQLLGDAEAASPQTTLRVARLQHSQIARVAASQLWLHVRITRDDFAVQYIRVHYGWDVGIDVFKKLSSDSNLQQGVRTTELGHDKLEIYIPS